MKSTRGLVRRVRRWYRKRWNKNRWKKSRPRKRGWGPSRRRRGGGRRNKNKVLAHRTAALRVSQWLYTGFVGPWNDFQRAAKANAVAFYGVWSPFYGDYLPAPPPLYRSDPIVSTGESFASAWFDRMFHHRRSVPVCELDSLDSLVNWGSILARCFVL